MIPAARRAAMTPAVRGMAVPRAAMAAATTAPVGGARAQRLYRYWPVFAIVSIERPASVPCLPDTSVRM
jgi:hypothetical protein